MTKHYLHDLFHPQSVAVVGGSERAGAIGEKVMRNLIHQQFSGDIYPVNPKHRSVFGKTCYPDVTAIPQAVDLAVITTPAQTVPDIIKTCGVKKIKYAVVISAGFSETGDAGKALEQSLLTNAQAANVHFIGPNCLGIINPHTHLNASFDNNETTAGSIALLSQSGAICAAILDWAVERNIGFSTVVSMGNSIDLDFGDILEYLAHDPTTKSILLYVEGVHYPERFMRGLRIAASVKPVIVLKAGRHASGVRAVHSHTGALVGDDEIFTSALRRAGAVRVKSIAELFNAAEILAKPKMAHGNRLLIVTNGGGAGVMAADRVADLGIELPTLDDTFLTKLNAILPAEWSHQNPIDIIGDATPARYRDVVTACLQANTFDGMLTILVPVAVAQPKQVAEELITITKNFNKPFITCWMGEKQVQSAKELFAAAQIPCYSTPEVAVDAFSYMADYYQSQELSQHVPEPLLMSGYLPAPEAAKKILEAVKKAGRTVLTTAESKALLAVFNIPIAKVLLAATAKEAVSAADSLGYPVVMKINSPAITHKQDVGGVILNLQTADAIEKAFASMMAHVKSVQPKAEITGVTLECMQVNPNNRELMIGVLRDKVFGPVISFGLGGTLVEVIRDRAVALPPLNDFLIQQLIAKTGAATLLAAFRQMPPANMQALQQVLLAVSQLVCCLPEIQEMDINPLLLNEEDAVVVDARFVIC